jgi:gliding motility-associated-like protein
MTKKITHLWVLLLCAITTFAGTEKTPNGWIATKVNDKVFIENKGQFNERYQAPDGRKILYAIQGITGDVYFTDKGVSYRLCRITANPERGDAWEKELQERRERYFLPEEKEEEEKPHFIVESQFIDFTWVGANPQVEVTAFEQADAYHSYAIREADGKNIRGIDHVKGYKKLVYKNLYPNIDVEYTFLPESGYKYSLILHPGADPSQVKMLYGKGERLSVADNGDLHIATNFGDIIEHAPLTFYSHNQANTIDSRFAVKNNTISFKLSGYDKNQSVVIDPWVQSPTFNTQWDCIWECEKDATGNAYVIGGVMPLQLIKYNAAGALQWTYNTPYDTSNSWLGTLATDNAGNSYVTRGSTSGIQKVSTTGTLTWNSNGAGTIGNSDEYWSISFNCDQTKLVVGGTSGAFALPPKLEATIFDINTNNGNIITSRNVAIGSTISFPPNVQEVRCITPCNNGRYYFLTHDTIGYIHQNFSLCNNNSLFYKNTNNYDMGYKCENFRVNNTGIAAMRYYAGYIYVNRGDRLDKRDFATGAIVSSVAIPGGGYVTQFGVSQVQNSGIDIDDCGNIYVGSSGRVVKFNQSLTQQGTFNTSSPYTVYDVQVSTGGNIIVCGSTGNSSSGARSGYVEQINASACAILPVTCCDPTICPQGPFCTSSAAVTLVSSTPGGVWSGPGITNTSTGVFNPATAGAGTHIIKYTLPCGADSITIVVSTCGALNACLEPNGTISVSNGVGPYTWQKDTVVQNCSACFFGCTIPPGCAVNTTTWVNYATGTNAPLPSDGYPVRVTDAAGTTLTINNAGQLQPCVTCPTITVTVPNKTNVTCPSTNNGSATVSASGGTGAYTYTWSPNVSTGATANNLTAGTYSVTVRDANNCSGTVSFTITAPNIPNITNAATQAESCAGQNNGSITSATATGGTGSYTWTYAPASNPANTTPIAAFPVNNLAPGNYILAVTSGGCVDTVQVNIAVGPNCCSISLAVSTVQPTCGQSDGGITVTPSPAGTYTYAWSNSLPATASQSNLATGQYSVTVTTSGNPTCTADTTINLNTSNGPTLTFSNPVNPTCAGSNGAITVALAGGAAPYTVTIDTGGTPQSFQLPFAITQTLNGLPAGTVTVTVVDANSCQATATATLTAPANCCTFTVADVKVQPNCGATDGSITLTVANGSGNYSYAWAGGNTSNALTNVGAGTYNVTITDNAYANCNLDTTYTLVNPNAPTLSAPTIVNETCPGTGNGTATINASGGTAPLSYLWSNSQTTQTATGLTAGTVTYTVTDGNSCQVSGSATIGSGFCCTLDISAQVTNGTCGQNNASITVSIDTSGTTPYTYSLNGGTAQQSGTFGNLAAGTYTVVATDGAGCKDTVVVTVQPSSNSLNVSINTTALTCNGSNDGTATAVVTGGTTPYTYLWSNTQTTVAITGLQADVYTVTVTDGGGCTGTATTSITEPAPLTLTLANDTTVCEGNSVVVDAGGGFAFYIWSSGQSTQTISPTTTGTYFVTVTDANGCTASDAIIVTFAPAATVDLGDDKVGYEGGDGVGLFANINPAVTGGTFVWTPDTLLSCNNCQSTVATPVDTITYSVLYTDPNGCRVSDSVTIYVLPPGSIFWPNAFTPNGDGNNDVYLPGGSMVKQMVWRIYNRWGEKVFESESMLIGWNGKYKNAPQPPNVYVYYAEVTYLNNTTEEFKGSITLIR